MRQIWILFPVLGLALIAWQTPNLLAQEGDAETPAAEEPAEQPAEGDTKAEPAEVPTERDEIT